MAAPSPRDEALARVDDYVSGHMDDGAAAAFEEALFDAAGDADAAFVDNLARLSALFAQAGGFDGGGTRAQVDQLRAAGLAVHVIELGSGGVFQIRDWDAGTQIVVARLGVDVRGYDAVDVECETPDGRPIKTFREVTCDPTDGALYAVCQERLARLAFARRPPFISRVVGTRGGAREIVAVYDVRPAG
jgi:hypothetical protein